MTPAETAPWQLLAKFAGSVGLFLLGMTLLTDGLNALAGPGMRRTLQAMTGNPLRGFAGGVAMTVLSQASSATVLATVGFVTAGILSLAAAIPVVVGATVGTSSTSWIVATVGMTRGVNDVLLPLLAVGAFMRALGRGRAKQLGTALAGLAIMLLAVGFIRDIVRPAVAFTDLSGFSAQTLLGRMQLVGIGLLLGTAMQSSAATIALAMAALHDHAIGWDLAAHLTIGATIGTTSTGIVATLGTRAWARRTAAAWAACALVQAACALLFFAPLRWIAQGFEHALDAVFGAHDGAIGIAAFHSAFTLLGAVPVLAMRTPLERALTRTIRQRGESTPVLELDRSALSVPGVAAATARRGIIQAGGAVAAAAAQLLRGGELRGFDERLSDAHASLAAARDFLGEIQVPEGDRATLEMQLASVGALDHLTRMIGDMQHLLPLAQAGSLKGEAIQPGLTEAGEIVGGLAAWLADPTAPSPGALLRARARTLSAQRQTERARTLAITAAGGLAPEEAMARLEALRQIDRLAHHAARAAQYLAGTTAPGDPGAARPGEDAQRELREEPS